MTITTGVAPVNVGSSSAVILSAKTTGVAPVNVGSSSIVNGVTQGMAPVSVLSSSRSFQIMDMVSYPDEDFSILIPIELSGLIDPIFPPPVPPVDFDGLVDPTVAPTLSKSDTTDGHLMVGTYRYSYAAWKGSPAQATAPSPPADITLTAEDTVTLTYPTINGADGYLVYREDL